VNLPTTIAVLRTLSETLGSFDISFAHFDWSSDTYKKTGRYIPDGGLDELKKHDAILFGAVGAPGECHAAAHLVSLCPVTHGSDGRFELCLTRVHGRRA
jgi:isocitrate/isopropylmalate dehydrogenase